ncbi:MAG: hypothetical protein AAGJ52_07270 [Pseudomonadota bacterium]
MTHSALPLILRLRGAAAALLLAPLVGACALFSDGSQQLELTYSRAAQDNGVDRNPVVMIPGLMGTTLVDRASGEPVWGGFERISEHPNDPTVFAQLALPHQRGLNG